MAEKIKTGSAPVANAQKKTIAKQITNGVQTSTKTVAGNSYANAHRTIAQSGTFKSSTPVCQGQEYEGDNKAINIGYVPTPMQPQHTFENTNSQIYTDNANESPKLQNQSMISQSQGVSSKADTTSTLPTITNFNNYSLYKDKKVSSNIFTSLPQTLKINGMRQNALIFQKQLDMSSRVSTPNFAIAIATPQHKMGVKLSDNNISFVVSKNPPIIQKQVSTPKFAVAIATPKRTLTFVSSSLLQKNGNLISEKTLCLPQKTLCLPQLSQSTTQSKSKINNKIDKNTLSNYKNKPLFSDLYNDLKYGGKIVLDNIQSQLSKSDDLGTQSINASIEGTKIGVTVFKGSQTVTDVGIHTIRGTAVAGVQVAKQVGLSAVTVAQSYDVIKAMNIAPISKQAMYLIKANAISTGLANTQISQGIAKMTQSIVNGATKFGNGVATVGRGIATGAKGVYSAVTTVGLATVTVAKAYNISKATNTFLVSAQGMKILRESAMQTGLNNTMVSKAIVNGVKYAQEGVINAYKTVAGTIQTGLNNVKVMTKAGVQTVKDTKNLVVATIRGIKAGTVSIGYVSYQLEKYAYLKAGQGIQTLWKGVRGTAKVGWQGAKFAYPKIKTVGKGGMKIAKGVKGGVLTGASLMKNVSDDIGIQGVATAFQFGDVAGRLGTSALKTSYNMGKGIGKAGIKTARTLEKVGMTFWESYYKTNSIKKAMFSVCDKGVGKIGEMLKNAGGSIVNMLINLAKSAGKKVVIPLILIIIVAVAGSNIITVPATAVGSIFSGIFGTTDDSNPDVETEQDVETWILTNIAPYSNDTRQEIADDMYADWKVNGGSYDIVRLKEVGGGSGVVEPTLDGVKSIFYTDAEITDMLEAIYNCKVLMDYDLSPTDTQAKNLLKDLYDKIFRVETIATTEYCGQDLKKGEGTALTPCSSTGRIHAITTGENACPNQEVGTHGSYTDPHCCHRYYTCNGHEVHSCTHSCGWFCEHFGCHHSCGSGCYHTEYCGSSSLFGGAVSGMSSPCSNSSEHNYCEGYSYCKGHEVNTYTLNLDGLYPILNETFYQPIDTLEALGSSRTQDQEEQLQNLKDYLEIYEIMAREVFQGTFGGGMTMEDLSGITFVDGSRTPNQDVVDLALSQVGQQGGQPYWSYYGFSSRVAWCACFVNWCMRNTPSATNSYPYSSNNAYCQTVANNLSSLGQFGHDSSIITTGDVIFFDWECDGHTDHIGIVIGRDNNKVYTVEGNSGDQVKIKSYNLSSSVIYGYGYLNY